MQSLDPRVNRLPKVGQPGLATTKAPLDQFGTFEVFVQAREGKPFQHEGIVHAPNIELAFVLAKEAFTRRFSCAALYVADTRHVFVSPYTEGQQSVYDLIPDNVEATGQNEQWEVYHLLKRGKQHVHAGSVQANSPARAMTVAKQAFGAAHPLNIWVIPTAEIRFTREEEKDFWSTLPDKKFRDAAAYKGGERLKEFLERKPSPQ